MRLIDADEFEVVGTKVPEGMDPESYMAGMDLVLNKIDNAPTINPEPQWILCSSGELPEEGKDVYVTCGNGRYAFTTEGKFCPRFGGWVSSWDNDFINVEAWMPEPEPYRKEGEEHDIR